MKKFITFLMFSFILKLSFAAITITPATIDAGYCENPYSFRAIAAGGTAPYSYTISVGTLPVGLTLNRTSGVISGIIHLTRDTTISFTVRATDKLSATGTRAYSMVITNKVVTWSQIVPYWSNLPNTAPTYAQVYDTWRLYALGASTDWTQGGNTVSTIKKLGTIDSLDLPFITKNVERGRFYSNGNGFNVTTAYYLDGAKFAYTPAAATGNTSIGVSAGNNATAGTQSTNVGSLSLAANTTGDFQTAVGYNSLRQNTTGTRSTAVGWAALTGQTTGADNTAIGYNSGSVITTGAGNTFIGYGASGSITTGSYNTFLGNVADLSAPTTSNNIILSDGQGNIRMHTIATGLTGIGTSTPATKLHVLTTGILTPLTLENTNTSKTITLSPEGTSTLAEMNTTNDGIQFQSVTGANRFNRTGAGSILFYPNGGVTSFHFTADVSGANEQLILKGSASTYNIGINTASPTAKLHILGTTNDNTAYSLKSARLDGTVDLSVKNDGAVLVPNIPTDTTNLTRGTIYRGLAGALFFKY